MAFIYNVHIERILILIYISGVGSLRRRDVGVRQDVAWSWGGGARAFPLQRKRTILEDASQR